MPVNAWSAGQDALLGFLAERDAKKRMDEDRARRDRLDAESFADRQRQREIQESQVRSIDEDRDERRKLMQGAAEDKKAAGQAAALNAAQIGELLDAYDAASSPEEKHAIGLRILNAGGKYQNEPAKPRDPIADHEAKKRIDQKYREPKAAPSGPKDDPRLPRGAKVWIESIAQRGVPLEAARNELSKGWGQQRAAHPNAELAAAADYLKKLYSDENPIASPTQEQQTFVGRGATPDVNLPVEASVQTPAVAAPPPPGGGTEGAQQQLFNDAHAVVSSHLRRNASKEEVAKFLSDPNNVAQLTKR